MRLAIFPLHLSCQVVRSAAPVTQNHRHKPTDLMLQNATPLRKSAPWPPNISDEHVFCTAPATRNASFQILFKCPTPAIVFETATKPSCFAHFWEGAQSLALSQAKRHLKVQKWREHVVFFTFWLRNVLRATTSCTFSTSPTSKSGPKPSMVYTFDFEMCFAPQRRALFRHLNFQKWSEAGVFCTFWRPLFRHLNFQKGSEREVLLAFSLQQRRALFHLSSGQMAPHPPLSLLFDPPEPQIIPRLSYLFAHLDLLSSDSFSSLIFSLLLFSSLWLFPFLLSSVHSVGSLTSKLPSIIFLHHKLVCGKTARAVVSVLKKCRFRQSENYWSIPQNTPGIWSAFVMMPCNLQGICSWKRALAGCFPPLTSPCASSKSDQRPPKGFLIWSSSNAIATRWCFESVLGSHGCWLWSQDSMVYGLFLKHSTLIVWTKHNMKLSVDRLQGLVPVLHLYQHLCAYYNYDASQQGEAQTWRSICMWRKLRWTLTHTHTPPTQDVT